MSIMSQEAKKQLGCVLHWSGESAISGTYDDDGNKRGFLILPDGVTVTPSGTFTTQKMKDGRNVWKFDGSTNYISLTNIGTQFAFGTGAMTICVWIYVSTSATARTIISKYTTWASNLDLHLYLTAAHQISIWFMPSTSSPHSLLSSALTTGAWHFAALTKTDDGVYTLYVNGVSVGTATNTNTQTNNTTTLVIGCSSESTPTEYFDSNIKDLMIFKKALTQDQIAAIMQEMYIY